MNFNKLDKEMNDLLAKVCVELGFCLLQNDRDRIASIGKWHAENFAKAVISAEGLNPDYEVRWYREIRNIFIQHFGSNTYERRGS